MIRIEEAIERYHLEQYFEDIEKYRGGMKLITVPKKSYVYWNPENEKYAFFLLEYDAMTR